jgi:hypothetical protein
MSQTTPSDQQVKVAIGRARIETYYANVFQVRYTPAEIFVTAGVSLPETDREGEAYLNLEMGQRFAMTPESAKRFAQVLIQSVQEYEQRFGVIKEREQS